MKWVRIGAVEEQAITAVYEFLSGLCGEYSNFREWYYEKIVPNLASEERLIKSGRRLPQSRHCNSTIKSCV